MNASDILHYGHRTVLRTLEGLPEEDWETEGVCGYWSVKNIIAHLASYEHVLIEVLSGFLAGGPTPYRDQYRQGQEAFNDPQVDERKHLAPSETLAEYREAHSQTLALVAQIPAEVLRQPGTLPWYGMEYALDDFIVYAYYGHKREHSAQVAVFRDVIKR